jgi:4-amino-4-deoxy-L-arabinose transferase-like glycosyltransferase
MRYASLALAVVCALVLFSGLDLVGFTDQREARDARVTREMIRHKEVLTPLYANEPHFEKPLLAYAPEFIAARLSHSPALRDTPTRSRQLRAIGALLLVLLTGALAARHFGRRAGAWSALVLASTLGLPIAARTDGTQVFGTLFGWIGCAALAEAAFGSDRMRNRVLLLAYGALAATLVFAGPLPALWPLGGVALYAWLARDRSRLARIRPLAGLTIMLGVALPWYGAMVTLHGARFLLAATTFPYGAEARGAWFTAPFLALSFLVISFHPWSALMPEAMLHAATWWRFGRRVPAPAPEPRASSAAIEQERREENLAHFFIASLIAGVTPIALYPGAPLPAALPALPAAAMLCGRFIDHVFEDPQRLARELARATRMLALVGSAATILIAIAAQRVPEAAADLRLVAAITFLTSWLPLLAQIRGAQRAAACLIVLPVALAAPIALAFVVPEMEDYLNTRSVASAMNERAPALAPLAMIGPAPPSLRVYCTRNLVVTTPAIAMLRQLRAADGLTYVAFEPDRESDVAKDVGVPLEIVARSASLVLARVSPDSTALTIARDTTGTAPAH